MEFKNVYVINCCEETIPHASSIEDNIEEERRLFYVGITRAIDNLYLFLPETEKGSLKKFQGLLLKGSLIICLWKLMDTRLEIRWLIGHMELARVKSLKMIKLVLVLIIQLGVFLLRY